jgi:hypothetical protein
MTNPSERGLTPEIMDERGTQLVEGIGRAIAAGLDPERIRAIEADEFASRTHRDIFRVYLGLEKPMAIDYAQQSKQLSVYAMYAFGDDYFSLFPKSLDTGVSVLHHGRMVWNPSQVDYLLKENAHHLAPLTPADTQDGPMLRSLVVNLLGKNATQAQQVVGARLLGIPQEAAKQHVAYMESARMLLQEIWNFGMGSNADEISVNQFVTGGKGIRDTVESFERQMPLNTFMQHLQMPSRAYLFALQLADIPGTPYWTRPGLTTEEEKRVRDLYDASGVEEKLGKLLASS